MSHVYHDLKSGTNVYFNINWKTVSVFCMKVFKTKMKLIVYTTLVCLDKFIKVHL